jgi:hypothetical protein
MCLHVKDGEKIRTASKNLVVWKLLVPWGKAYKSPYRRFVYYPRRIYKPVSLKVKGTFPYDKVVHKGFHAFTSKSMARFWCYKCDEVVVKMIIPKGSKYILGYNSEIVSSHIRFPKKGE